MFASFFITYFTFATFTARYVSLRGNGNGAMTTMLKLYNS